MAFEILLVRIFQLCSWWCDPRVRFLLIYLILGSNHCDTLGFALIMDIFWLIWIIPSYEMSKCCFFRLWITRIWTYLAIIFIIFIVLKLIRRRIPQTFLHLTEEPTHRKPKHVVLAIDFLNLQLSWLGIGIFFLELFCFDITLQIVLNLLFVLPFVFLFPFIVGLRIADLRWIMIGSVLHIKTQVLSWLTLQDLDAFVDLIVFDWVDGLPVVEGSVLLYRFLLLTEFVAVYAHLR